jgi:hypothetical protein
MLSVEFSDAKEAETLLRAAVLFKFEGGEEAGVFTGSPVFAKGVRSLLDAVAESARSREGADRAEKWRAIYRLDGHRERWEFVAGYAARHPGWRSMTAAERDDWIDTVAAPYWLNEEARVELVRYIDGIAG